MRAERSALTVLATVVFLVLGSPAARAQLEVEPVLPDKLGRTVLYTTEYLNVSELQSILYLLDAEVVTKPSLNIVAARSEDETVLQTIEEIIATLDVPPVPVPNIELTAQILTTAGSASSEAVPARIGDELQRLFGHRDFSVLDTIFLQIGDGSGGRVEGSFTGEGTAIPTGYQFYFDSVQILPGKEKQRLRLEALTFEVTGENATGLRRAVLRTDVELPDGHRMVVGKATPRGTDETLVVVIQATVQKL